MFAQVVCHAQVVKLGKHFLFRDLLLEELVEREQRLTSLQSRLDAEKAQRLSAVESVDKILGRLEQLQTSVTNTAVGKTQADRAL